ncbi:hypothetical protein QE152_g35340 [Popillia japonica]|uniref:Uncharacterized protein n=1 Tax=Popillia japonica TaxID=7064 RepID=A0AAW1IFX9_POPJA
MIRYSAVLNDTNLASPQILKSTNNNLNPKEHLASILELHEPDPKGSLSEIVSQGVNHEDLVLKTVPQELDMDNQESSHGKKSQELNKDAEMTVART